MWHSASDANASAALWQTFLRSALEADLGVELAAVRARQENYLRRELDRIEDYFATYEQELSARAARSASQNAMVKTADRLAVHVRERLGSGKLFVCRKDLSARYRELLASIHPRSYVGTLLDHEITCIDFDDTLSKRYLLPC